MYFGAGNLIFPVMIGIQSGTNAPLAVLGFLITGTLLPVLGMIALATARPEENNTITARIGSRLGRVLLTVIFLSTGMLYAVPRVATVSYEMAVRPLLPETLTAAHPHLCLFAYSAVFFIAVAALTLNPGRILDRIGTFLTPVLLIFLAFLIIFAVAKMPTLWLDPHPDFTDAPLGTGLIQGYFTMDALASLVFGFIVIQDVKARGFSSPRQCVTTTAVIAFLAGLLLMVIYVALASIGLRVADQGFTNGANALAYAAIHVFGPFGMACFGIIVILACLTTGIGLIGSSAQYFREMIPSVAYRTMILGQIFIAFLLANLGLETILAIVSPINQLIYPVAICLIVLALVDAVIALELHWTYRVSAWAAGIISIFEALWSTGLAVFSPLRDALDYLPLGSIHMAWVVPSVVGALIGAALDWRRALVTAS